MSENTGIYTGRNAALMRNNLMIELYISTQMHNCWGDFSNNMIIRCSRSGFYNVTSRGQPLIPDFNLFWDNGDFVRADLMQWGENNLLDEEPKFEEDSYILNSESPGFDQGRPDLNDLDGSRSDIGVHGGPHAYTHP